MVKNSSEPKFLVTNISEYDWSCTKRFAASLEWVKCYAISLAFDENKTEFELMSEEDVEETVCLNKGLRQMIAFIDDVILGERVITDRTERFYFYPHIVEIDKIT